MKSLPFPIVFEDDSFLVINKPAGITVNKSETTIHEDTVQDVIERYLDIKNPFSEAPIVKNADGFVSDEDAFYQRAGIAHRLDKETSGILLIAKNVESFSNLLKQFRERTVKKSYLALAHGKISPKEGEINVPVGRLPWNRRQFGVVAGGREAKTFYEVRSFYKSPVTKHSEMLTLVELFPVTGRTHQIRVHLQYIHHPIFSDFLYAGRKVQREDRKVLGRVFLHAYTITLNHPVSGEKVTYKASLPDELQKVIDALDEVEMIGEE